ncbi:MAG TPA: hypothetical protein VF463_21605 [Sphingobium sp.]
MTPCHAVDPARNCLTVYGNFLTIWQSRDFGAHLNRLPERVAS